MVPICAFSNPWSQSVIFPLRGSRYQFTKLLQNIYVANLLLQEDTPENASGNTPADALDGHDGRWSGRN